MRWTEERYGYVKLCEGTFTTKVVQQAMVYRHSLKVIHPLVDETLLSSDFEDFPTLVAINECIIDLLCGVISRCRDC